MVELTSLDTFVSLTTTTPGFPGPVEVDVLFDAVFVRFPITGITGDLASIEHAGGITISSQTGPFVIFMNLVLDTGANQIFAELNSSGTSNFPLFDLVPCQGIGTCPVGNNSSVLTGIGLNFSPEAHAALLDIGVELPINLQFGIVKQVSITLLPEPATAMLVLAGLGGIALASRRRRRRGSSFRRRHSVRPRFG